VIKGKAVVDGLGEGGGFLFPSNGLKFIAVVHVEHVHDESLHGASYRIEARERRRTIMEQGI
jgi:hypothetical protein